MSSDPAQPPGIARAIRPLGWALGCGLAIAGFYDARRLNSGFALPTGTVFSVPESEQVFYVWYGILGSVAVACLAKLLTELGAIRAIRRTFATALERPDAWIASMAMLVFAASFGFRQIVLLDQPVTDDEGTYLFIARTLLAGRFTNPVPDDSEFFANQFVVINQHGWHGKYPIGHPLLLALGEAVGLVGAVVPLVAAGCVLLAYRLGKLLFDPKVALAGASLLLISPHFVWTAATLLSQPTLCLVMLAGMLLLLRADPPRLRDLAWAGFVFGFGVLVRPLPGVLFGMVAAGHLALGARRRGESVGRSFGQLAVFGAAAAPWFGLFAIVNYVQSGNAFTSGYHEIHGGLKVLYNDKGQVVNAIVGSLLRENFWLLGWTFALLLLLWARPSRAGALFWGMLAAELAYRVIAPKTVVAVTGPIYLTEVLPLLTLAVADALARIGGYFRDHPVRPSVVGLAATLIAVGMFVPIPLGALATGAATRSVVYDLLVEAEADQALVFMNGAVNPKAEVTWAYYPDNPSPQLDDRWLFVRVPTTPDMRDRMIEFWQRRFPDRRAFVFAVASDGPRFSELQRPGQ